MKTPNVCVLGWVGPQHICVKLIPQGMLIIFRDVSWASAWRNLSVSNYPCWLLGSTCCSYESFRTMDEGNSHG